MEAFVWLDYSRLLNSVNYIMNFEGHCYSAVIIYR